MVHILCFYASYSLLGLTETIEALGVILLELGLWERVDQLDKGVLLTPSVAVDPWAVQQRILKHANRRLGFYTGDKYRDVVVGCLSGSWGEQDGSDGVLSEGVPKSFDEAVNALESVGREL
jgi:hypothetical protein